MSPHQFTPEKEKKNHHTLADIFFNWLETTYNSNFCDHRLHHFFLKRIDGRRIHLFLLFLFFVYGAFTNSVTVTSPIFRPHIRLFFKLCMLFVVSLSSSLFEQFFCDDYFVRVCVLCFILLLSLVFSLYSVTATEFVNGP